VDYIQKLFTLARSGRETRVKNFAYYLSAPRAVRLRVAAIVALAEVCYTDQYVGFLSPAI